MSNLNNDYGILTTDVDTQLFVGVEEPNTTLETLIILPNHNDTLFQDYGYPQYEYPVRSPGDGTVPFNSITGLDFGQKMHDDPGDMGHYLKNFIQKLLTLF